MVAPTAEVLALVELVADHPATSPREAAAKERFLVELALLDDPFNEHADPTHVTASAIVVGSRGTVLHLHKRLARWMQPGGHIDPGETPPAAARREATEELGLDVVHPNRVPRLIHIDVHEAALGHTHLDLRYLLLAQTDDPHPPPGESPEARWYDWDEAAAMADEALAPALVIARVGWEVFVEGSATKGSGKKGPGKKGPGKKGPGKKDAAKKGSAKQEGSAKKGSIKKGSGK